MVGEFPELQGTMGRYYAPAAGLLTTSAAAAEEHYAPQGPSDAVPNAPVSVAVGLADRLDTLTGFWAIGEKPTGSGDPFALRRAALGTIRLILWHAFRVRLTSGHLSDPDAEPTSISPGIGLLGLSYRRYLRAALRGHFSERLATESMLERLAEKSDSRETGSSSTASISLAPASTRTDLRKDLLAFLHDRLKVYLRDLGIRHDVIDASLAMPNSDDLTLLVRRAEALQALLDTEDGTNLVQGFRRANNILTQAEERDGVEYSYGADAKFAREPEERALFAALDEAEAEIAPAMAEERFEDAMRAMARLRGPIDAFFEAVQVNAEDGVVRRNRLNLLARIRDICLGVADLRRLEG